MDTQFIYWIATPAVVASLIAFLIRLIGKMIADFEVHVDDSKYASDFFGVTYFLGFILFPLAITAPIIWFTRDISWLRSPWLLIPITLLVGTYHQLRYFGQTDHYFEREGLLVRTLISIIDNNKWRKFVLWLFQSKQFAEYRVSSGILFASVAYGILSGKWVLITINTSFVIMQLLIIPAIFAATTRKLLHGTVVLADGYENKNCTITRITNNYVKYRVGTEPERILNFAQLKEIRFD